LCIRGRTATKDLAPLNLEIEAICRHNNVARRRRRRTTTTTTTQEEEENKKYKGAVNPHLHPFHKAIIK